MAELQLALLNEEKVEKTITVNRQEFTLGRLPQCDLYLPFAGISRNHARFIHTSDGNWVIEDLNSTNGTEVNGKIIKCYQPINHGDLVKIGSAYLRIILGNHLPINEDENFQASTIKTTILRNAKELQQQWISAETQGDKLRSQEKAIARLKDLVEIANGLNYAESIEAIFHQVQAVVFRYLKSIDRLALLVDVRGSGSLQLLNSATKSSQDITVNGNWISRSICQKVFIDKVAIQTADAQADQRFEGEPSILMKGIRSAMAVPIWDENQVVGVLYGDGHIYHGNPAKAGEDDLSFFSALANLVAASVQRWLLTQKLRTEENIRQRLERYHSPAVVQQMMRVGASDYGRIPPTEGDISILFADIVGFTAISERLAPGQIAELLNNFFEEMLQEVFSVGGTLDKFIGDCIMAFFGAPEPQIDHADRAVAAAQGMLKRLEDLNARQGLQEPLQLRIAINSGKAVVGDVGSSQRFDYTVLGATINLASRMETICVPGKCVISETTYSLLKSPAGFNDIGEHRFKGIERSIRVYQN